MWGRLPVFGEDLAACAEGEPADAHRLPFCPTPRGEASDLRDDFDHHLVALRRSGSYDDGMGSAVDSQRDVECGGRRAFDCPNVDSIEEHVVTAGIEVVAREPNVITGLRLERLHVQDVRRIELIVPLGVGQRQEL